MDVVAAGRDVGIVAVTGVALTLTACGWHPLVKRPTSNGMNIDLTDEQAAALLRELDAIIASDRYFLSPRITTLKAIRSKIRPEPVREPSPPQRHYEPPRVGARRRR
jgi:hypothetical protein